MFVAVVVRCPDSVGVKCSDERPLCAAIRTEHCTPNGVRAATMFLLYKHCTPTEFVGERPVLTNHAAHALLA